MQEQKLVATMMLPKKSEEVEVLINMLRPVLAYVKSKRGVLTELKLIPTNKGYQLNIYGQDHICE